MEEDTHEKGPIEAFCLRARKCIRSLRLGDLCKENIYFYVGLVVNDDLTFSDIKNIYLLSLLSV